MGRSKKKTADYPGFIVENEASGNEEKITIAPPAYSESLTGNIYPESPVVAVYNRYDTMTSYAGPLSTGMQPIKMDGVAEASAPSTFLIASTAVGGALDEPFLTQCPFCRATVTTRTEAVSGCLTYLSCAIVSVLTSFMCCCLPFCLRSCKDIKHYCPECNSLIAIYKRI